MSRNLSWGALLRPKWAKFEAESGGRFLGEGTAKSPESASMAANVV